MRSRIVRAAARPTKRAPTANFTGAVLQDEVFAPEAPSRMRASKVTFTPGARTNCTPTPSARCCTCFPA